MRFFKQRKNSLLENKIKYRFKKESYLEEALTHKSYSMEKGLSFCNERLEFLGDSVLGLCVASYLFLEKPDEDEGKLSKIKSYIVSKNNLVFWAKKINLQNNVKMGGKETAFSIENKDAIMADAFEALLGAIYLDSGYEKSYEFILNFLKETTYTDPDYKSKLQEIIQKKHKTLPVYSLISTDGPEHNKTFIVNLSIKNKIVSIGKGKTKKEAQQDAAKNALNLPEYKK